MSLTWAAPNSLTGIANFELQRCATSACASPTTAGIPSSSSTSQLVTGLTASTTYHFRIRAIAKDDVDFSDSPWSEWDEYMPVNPALLEVEGLEVDDASSTHNSVKLTWTAPGTNDLDNIKEFKIEICESAPNSADECTDSTPTPLETVAKDAGPPYTHEETMLTTGTTYYFRIRAIVKDDVEDLQNSDWSDWVELQKLAVVRNRVLHIPH